MYHLGLVHPTLEIGFFASLFLLLLACVLTFVWFRFANLITVVAALLSLYCFFQTEKPFSPWINSWIFLNLPDPPMYVTGREVLLAKLRILSVAWLTFVAAISVLRLFPARWTFRAKAINRRIWLAGVVSVLVLFVWFAKSVVPYRIPGFGHGIWPGLVILHIQKDGFQFHETRLTVRRDREFFISRNHRRLMQYSFAETKETGNLTPELHAEILMLSHLENLGEPEKLAPEAMKAWNAEGWYLVGENGLWAYTTENGKTPPEKIARIFGEIESLPVSPDATWHFKDICMGFCYDTLAALGFRDSQQRCHVDLDGKARCR